MLLQMPKVVLDANALMMPFQFGLNIDAELSRLLGKYEAVVPSSIRSELKRLAARSAAAKAALRLAEKFTTFKTTAEGDQSIIEAAKTLRAIVVTNDSELLETLEAEGIPRIRLRSRSHLVIEGY